MMNDSKDEVDLVQFSVNITRFLRKNLLAIAGFTLLGILASITFGLRKSQVNQSKMLLFSDMLTKSYVEQLTKNMNNILYLKENPSGVSPLNLTPGELQLVHSVDVDFVPEKPSKEMDREYATLIISAEFSDRKILPALQSAIIDYFRNNQFVKVRVGQRKIFYQKMISKIKNEIRSLDSMKLLFLSGKAQAGKSELAFVDPSEINKNIVDFYEEELKDENALNNVDSIQLVQGFTSVERPQRLRISILILFGFIGGLFLSLCYLGLRWVLKQSND